MLGDRRRGNHHAVRQREQRLPCGLDFVFTCTCPDFASLPPPRGAPPRLSCTVQQPFPRCPHKCCGHCPSGVYALSWPPVHGRHRKRSLLTLVISCAWHSLRHTSRIWCPESSPSSIAPEETVRPWSRGFPGQTTSPGKRVRTLAQLPPRPGARFWGIGRRVEHSAPRVPPIRPRLRPRSYLRHPRLFQSRSQS